jgi:hypothetical protein
MPDTRNAWRTAVTVLVWASAALGRGQPASGPAPAVAANDTSHAARCLAGVDLAIMAAEAGIIDVSFEAMHRATISGPPVASVELGGLLGDKSAAGARAAPGVPSREQEVESAQMKMASRLQTLHAMWQKQKVDPGAAYAAFKSIVLPDARSNEAFSYAVSTLASRRVSFSSIDLDREPPKPIACGAAALVEWAKLAGREDDLLAEVEKRAQLPGAASAALLIKAILGCDAARAATRESVCEQLTTQTNLVIDAPDAELLLGHVWHMLELIPPDDPERRNLLDAVLNATARGGQDWSKNGWLLFLVTNGIRTAIETGDRAAFRRCADTALTVYDSLRAYNSDYVADQEAGLYVAATVRALEAGQFALAADCIRAGTNHASSERYLRAQASALLDPTQSILPNLLELDRGERFELLNSLVWQMPQLGLQSGARTTGNDRVPPLFVSAGPVPPAALVWRELTRPSACSVSLLEWTMREAIALGRQEAIEKEVATLEASRSDDAKLAKLVYRLAQGKPLDLTPLIATDADGDRRFTPLLGDGGGVTPLDMEVLEQALASEEHRSLGVRLADDLLQRAKDETQFRFISLLRGVKARVSTPPPAATHEDLRHWIVADDTAAMHDVSGHVPQSLWVKRDGDNVWGQQVGIDYSMLMLRYPLTGTFTVAFRTRDGPYQVGGVTLGGRLIEFQGVNGGLQISALSRGNGTMVATEALVKDRFNAVRLERQAGKLIVYVGEDFRKELAVAAGDFPFLGMGAHHCDESSFDSLAIDGDVIIPRSVDLLSPSLAGWSGRFKGQRLPALAVLPEQQTEIDEADEATITDDWRFAAGGLESVDRTKDGKANNRRPARAKREALIRYLRPLADGERISLEFFHKPGTLSLAPAVGRIAMLLDEEKVALHWITVDPAGIITGVDDSNSAVDEQAEQLQAVVLKANDWNQLTLRLDGDVVTLAINERDTYRRTWEPEAGREFGLFRDPARFHVRVRNASLSGPWPEKLPADLFELKPKDKVPSAE